MKRFACGFALALVISLPSVGRAGYWLNGKYYAKGVECDVTAGGLGNVTKNSVTLTCTIGMPDGANQINGLALCENPGGNKPPGLFPAAVTVSFSETVPIDPTKVMKNGKAFVPIVTNVPDQYLVDLSAACPNTLFRVTDFIPCDFNATLLLEDATGTKVTEVYACTFGTLDQCYTLVVDKKTGLPEKKEYQCTLLQ